MAITATQLPLHLNPNEFFQLENFYFGQDELQSAVDLFCQFNEINFLYLWGERAVGKSHLLMAIVDKAQKDKLRVAYLPLAELVASAEPELLVSLENLDVLCIDELESIAANQQWQEALFHCFNRLQQSGCKLVVAARKSPNALALELADLRSRLATGLIYQIQALDDDGKQQILVMQARARGLDIADDVAQYLLRHYSRDSEQLMALLHTLDTASLIEKRRLTIPFIKQTLLNGQN